MQQSQGVRWKLRGNIMNLRELLAETSRNRESLSLKATESFSGAFFPRTCIAGMIKRHGWHAPPCVAPLDECARDNPRGLLPHSLPLVCGDLDHACFDGFQSADELRLLGLGIFPLARAFESAAWATR